MDVMLLTVTVRVEQFDLICLLELSGTDRTVRTVNSQVSINTLYIGRLIEQETKLSLG